MTKPVIISLIAASIVLGAIPTPAAAQTSYPAAWDAMSFTEVKAELERLRDHDLGAGRKLMAGYVTQRFSSVSSVNEAEVTEWLWMVFITVPDQPYTTKTAFAQEIIDNLAPDSAAISQLDNERAIAVFAALRRLGQKSKACSAAATWVEQSDAFKSLPLKELASLTRVLGIDSSIGAQARANILQYIELELLPNAAVGGSGSIRGWLVIAETLEDDLSAADKVRWADSLVASFGGSDQALASMDGKSFTALAEALMYLSKAHVRQLGRLWVAQHPRFTWPEATREQVTYLAVALRQAKQGKAASHLGANWIAANGDGQEQAFQESSHTLDDCISASRSWHAKGDVEKAHQWAQRAYDIALAEQSPSKEALVRIGHVFEKVGLGGEGKADYTEFAEAVADLARSGVLSNATNDDCDMLSVPICSPETRTVVEAELVDPVGQPRVAVGNILSWSHRRARSIKPWRATLEQKIATQDISADVKARWLVIRAYAESLASFEPSPSSGKQWFDEALATANSESCRVAVLRVMVEAYSLDGKHDYVVGLLDSVSGQFGRPELALEVQTLRDNVLADKVQFQSEQNEIASERTRGLLKARRRAMRKRLSAARVKGDDVAEKRYERLLGNLPAEDSQ